VTGACKAGARLDAEELLFILCPLWLRGGMGEEQAAEVDMVVTLGQGWEDGVDAILTQYCEGSILG
jgi:hypothetical protein